MMNMKTSFRTSSQELFHSQAFDYQLKMVHYIEHFARSIYNYLLHFKKNY